MGLILTVFLSGPCPALCQGTLSMVLFSVMCALIRKRVVAQLIKNHAMPTGLTLDRVWPIITNKEAIAVYVSVWLFPHRCGCLGYFCARASTRNACSSPPVHALTIIFVDLTILRSYGTFSTFRNQRWDGSPGRLLLTDKVCDFLARFPHHCGRSGLLLRVL